MYGFGSKYEGLVIAKIEVNGLWLLPKQFRSSHLELVLCTSLTLEERKTDKSLTLLSQLSVYHTPA